ncbi:MAG: type IV fimbrial biogenesis protein FimT [Methylophilaceae bacterium]|jgi:type IV fimbrial biogenesis protein FimT
MLVHQLKQEGFSLIELMITTVLFAVLASLAIPSYQQMIQNSMIKSATDAIVSGFQVARAEAVSRNRPVQLELGGGTSSAWNVCVQPTPAGKCASGLASDMIQTRSESDGSSGETTATAPAGERGPYIFSGFGVMTSPGGAAIITVDSTDTTITRRQLQIVISAGGAVRSCDPKLPKTGADATDPRRCPGP